MSTLLEVFWLVGIIPALSFGISMLGQLFQSAMEDISFSSRDWFVWFFWSILGSILYIVVVPVFVTGIMLYAAGKTINGWVHDH